MNRENSPFKTRDLVLIALLGAILFVTFFTFSYVLYLEMITFILVALTMSAPKHYMPFAVLVFGFCLTTQFGFSNLTIMYVLIYELYVAIVSYSREFLEEHRYVVYVMIGFLSFLTGQLMDLGWMVIIGKWGTIAYMIMGLKTSLIQGCLSFIVAIVLYDPVIKLLERLFKEYEK